MNVVLNKYDFALNKYDFCSGCNRYDILSDGGCSETLHEIFGKGGEQFAVLIGAMDFAFEMMYFVFK